MEQRQAGTSSLTLSTLGFGTWQLGSKGEDDYWGLEFTDELANALVQQAAEAGVTYFDTAEDCAPAPGPRALGSLGDPMALALPLD